MVMMGMLLAAAAPERLEPAGRWLIDYGQNGCLVARAYGKGAGDVTVGWRTLPQSESAQLVVNRAMPQDVMRRGMATVSISSGETQTVPFDAFSYGSPPMRRIQMQVKTAMFANAAPDSVLSISLSNGTALELPLPGLAKAWAAATTCNQSLLKDWDIDPAEVARVATPAKGVGEADWVTQDDYPVESLRRREIGSTTILWTIGVDGRVEACRNVISTGSPRLDKAACDAITRRGKYAPALDAEGRPLRSVQVRAVNWSVPGAYVEDKAYQTYFAKMIRGSREKARPAPAAATP